MEDTTPTPPFEDPCVVFKPLTVDGGLERYVSELARAVDAPVYTARRSISPAHFEGVDVRQFGDRGRTERLLARLPFGSLVDLLEYENLAVPEEHDAVVTVGEVTKAVVHRPHQRRFHLLNMPPRWLFDRGPGLFDGAPGPLRLLQRLYQAALRAHDVTTVSRLEDVVVPSEVVGRRFETYYGRSADEVVYPPVPVDEFSTAPAEGFLLYVGRLAEAKRVREIVRTLSNTEYQLQVAGTGPLEDELRSMAGPNVEVLGYVDEERKRSLLARCDGLVFNSDAEAFGIVPIEAFASGKPVVGVVDGFTRFQIEPGVNGVPFERGRLLEAVEELYERDWDGDAIRETAEQYGVDRFRARWRRLLLDAPADGERA